MAFSKDLAIRRLRHGKEGANKDSIEMVCIVPAIWNQSAIRKMMVEEAQRRVDFGSGRNVEDVFVVSEPEAAAAHVLANYPNVPL